jgi:chromosome segregation ATPase
MAENDADDVLDTSSDVDPSSGTDDDQGTDWEALVASARKRQAGAEAARQAAEAKARELETRLADYEKSHQSQAEKELSDLAATQARLEDAERRAAEAEAKAEARVLDAKYPNARLELPEVTDEVRLAKFEAMLADGTDAVPTPLRHNESRSGSQGAGVKPKEKTAAELAAELEAMPPPW